MSLKDQFKETMAKIFLYLFGLVLTTKLNINSRKSISNDLFNILMALNNSIVRDSE